MGKVKIPRDQQPTSVAPLLNGDKATKGYPAVTRFAQAPAPSANSGNGLPHQLQQGVEALSGMSMAGTSVYYNSSAPAQISALAYAAGNQIHLGPGQEHHLPHEAWHVVQQKQGRVKPTLQAKGLAVNDDHALETEADVMGQRAVQLKTSDDTSVTLLNNPALQSVGVVQRKIGFEFQAVKSIFLRGPFGSKEILGRETEGRFKVEGDGGVLQIGSELELITKAVEETPQGREDLVKTMAAIVNFLDEIKHGDAIKDIPKINWEEEVKKPYDLSMWIPPPPRSRTASSDPEVERRHTEAERKRKEEEKKGDRATARLLKEKLSVEGEEFPKFVIAKTGKHFHPQATVGVKFEKIADLIEYITNAPIKKHGRRVVKKRPKPEVKEVEAMITAEAEATGSSISHEQESKAELTPGTAPAIITNPQEAANVFGWGAKRYHKPYKAAWGAAMDEVNLIPGLSPQVKGLAAFFYGLAKNQSGESKDTIDDPRFPKQAMPFMLRNGLLPFFNNLIPSEVEQLKQIYANGVWDMQIMPENKHNKNEFKSKKIPTVKQIFKDILKDRSDDEKKEDKRELLKRERIGGHAEITNDKESLKLYDMTRIDDIGDSDTEPAQLRQGAIIELRKLGSDVPPEKLMEFALAVFDLIVLINAGEGSSSAAPPSPPSSTSSLSTSSTSPLAAV